MENEGKTIGSNGTRGYLDGLLPINGSNYKVYLNVKSLYIIAKIYLENLKMYSRAEEVL